MSDFSLKRESIEEILDYNVLISTYDNNAEQRRLKTAKKLIGFRIKSPALTKTQMQQYRNFLINKYGTLDSFTFTSPFDDTEYTIRFVLGSFKTIFRSGYYRCSFEFMRLP